MKRFGSFLKGIGALCAILLLGVGVWTSKEWLGIPDIAVLAILIYVSYLAAGYENFKLKDELNDLRSDFDLYREQSEEELDRLDRRIQVIYEDINALHPDGPDRHFKKLGLGDFGL